MKKIVFSSLLLLCQLVAAELNPSGYVRGMYVGDVDNKASAVGGSIEINPKYQDFYTDVAFFNSTPIGQRKDGVDRLFSPKESGYSILGVAALGYKKDGLDVLVGRQRVVTPLIDMDDGRIIPNLYEGVSLKYSINEKARLEAYYLSKMSGFWATIFGGSDMSKFVSMSEAAGYASIVPNASVMAIGGIYEDGFGKLNLWAYHSKDLLDLYYGEYSLSKKIGKNTSLNFAIQATSQNADGKLERYLESVDKTLNQQYAAIKLGGHT